MARGEALAWTKLNVRKGAAKSLPALLSPSEHKAPRASVGSRSPQPHLEDGTAYHPPRPTTQAD